jgi:hypothetical protein
MTTQRRERRRPELGIVAGYLRELRRESRIALDARSPRIKQARRARVATQEEPAPSPRASVSPRVPISR